MDEPPAKRPRRDDPDHTASPRSPRPNDQKSSRRHDDRDDRNGYSRDNDRKRRRSRSPGSRRNRSRDRERSYRDRDRDRYRDGDRRDHRSRKHSRSRSRSPPRTGPSGPKRTRSPPRGPRNDHDRRVKDESKAAVNGAIQEVPMKMEEDEDEEAYMKRVMGFGGFNTTKNKKVPGNQWYGVWKVEKVKYRQYMNRQGGFNRPLSPG